MNTLTFDIEDWWVYDHYHIGNKRDWLPRLDNYLNHILELLDERNFKATFFILGSMAKDYPNVVKNIYNREHHIGCHSFSHTFWKEHHSHREVSEDTRIALDVIENIIGQKVNAYRAPAFSITEKTSWILSILVEHGIEYDCSIFPANRSFGGFSGYKATEPAIINIDGIHIKEFPISPTTIFGKKIVYSGGGYFRLFPYSFIKSIISKNDYVMTYFHIKDFDKEQKRIYKSLAGSPAPVRYFSKYYGLKNNYAKFMKLISDFDFISVEQAANSIDWENIPVVKLININ